jgi:hypothetical protein
MKIKLRERYGGILVLVLLTVIFLSFVSIGLNVLNKNIGAVVLIFFVLSIAIVFSAVNKIVVRICDDKNCNGEIIKTGNDVYQCKYCKKEYVYYFSG